MQDATHDDNPRDLDANDSDADERDADERDADDRDATERDVNEREREPLDSDCDAWGIADGYHDVKGRWVPVDPKVRERLRESMGDPEPGAGPWFVVEGEQHQLWSACDIELEEGAVLRGLHALPPDLPIGYHELRPADGSPSTTLIVHPRRCPELPRAWGVAVQTYALWSERSWGAGDLGDLAALCEGIARRGGGAVLISPMHQPAPVHPIEASPYYPSTRRAWSPLLMSMSGPPPEHLRARAGTLIDRDAVWDAKRAALLAEYLDGHAAEDRVQPSDVAWWNARAEVEAGATEDVELLARFHEWLQVRLGEQLARVASTGVSIIGDLAVGFNASGADAHAYRDVLALDMRLGAPPDPFNEEGQDWGIPPFIPSKLRAAGYRPFIETVRAVLRGVQGLRIDHAMGLFRQFWIPADGSPSDGGYVRFPADDLLAILALEATRAGAFVIGEDLGTVEEGVREKLSDRRIAGTKVLWFEDEPPSAWPAHSLATVTTHDLPTITGVFGETDGGDDMRTRLDTVAPGALRAGDAIDAAHQALLDSPARLRLLTADDIAGAADRPNLPGLNDHPSWRLRLPIAVDELVSRLPGEPQSDDAVS